MRTTIIAGASGTASLIAGIVAPMVIPPTLPEWSRYALLGLAGTLWAVAITAYFLGKKGIEERPVPSQATSGAQSHAIQAARDVHIHHLSPESPWERLTASAKESAIEQQNRDAARAQIIRIPRYKTWDDRPVKRDKSLHDGLIYAACGIWPQGADDKLPDFFEKYGSALQQFHQLARDGELSVWGKPSRFQASGVYEPIAPEAWSEGSIDFLDALRPGETRMKRRDNGHLMFVDPMVSQAEFERTWPHGK